MVCGLNKVMVIGRLGRDPEIRYTHSRKSMVVFYAAGDRFWGSANRACHSETVWVNI